MNAPLHIHPAPFLKPTTNTPRIMLDVLLALAPIVAASVWFFGLGALLIVCTAAASAMATEWVVARGRGTLADRSALLTGVLLGLTLPPSMPLWMAALGGFVAIALGKSIWGGLGQNLFNPALVGRAFLQAAFPIAITTWTPQGQGLLALPSSLFALPLMHGEVDGVTGATPLNQMKFDGLDTDPTLLLLGDHMGSLGETSALLLVLAGAWLLWRRAFDWRIPTSMLGTVLVLATGLWALGASPSPWFMLTSGGLLFGAVFMATDPVTSPLAPRAAWVFGAGAGLLVVLIRLWGGLPEGVMYAILLMNAATPLLDRWLQPRPFGRAG
jgi:Na+-translocating ferredoxin:NAD+ oxidoreductase subunit D